MLEVLVRVLVGGSMVSFFALLADVITPKSFAGLMSAAPSVALATLILTLHVQGAADAATESRSMMAGAVAFGAYAHIVCLGLIRWPLHVLWPS